MNLLPTIKDVLGRLPDETLNFALTGYPFIADRCKELGTDAFVTRLMLQRTICMTGAEAARVFYDGERFERAGAAPHRLLATLFGKDGVQTLDGPPHHARKELFMRWLGPDQIRELCRILVDEWRAAVPRWPAHVTLLHAAEEVLCRAVCKWTGVPLAEDEVGLRTRELVAMIEGGAAVGPKHWYARLSRTRAEQWIRGLLEARASTPEPSTALEAFAVALPPEIGAVEILNILRPTVAIARFITFAALALHDYPAQEPRDDAERLQFIQEVRRFYPFMPAAVARVKTTFSWSGVLFPRGTRVMLDLYGSNRDPRVWDHPGEFRAWRFRDRHLDPFTLIPQGGGTTLRGHRCAGETLTIDVMIASLRFLQDEVLYSVPAQDLSIDLRQIPAAPASKFRITGVQQRRPSNSASVGTSFAPQGAHASKLSRQRTQRWQPR